MKRFGYKKGILAGLLLYAGGALLVYPVTEAQSWSLFLIALFILACGLAFLETAANPYATVLGPRENSEQRLNLAQSFNGVGVITGPLVGGLFVFGATAQTVQEGFRSVQLPYIIVGVVVLLVAVLFYFTPMPEVEEEELVGDKKAHTGRKLWQHKHFSYAVLAQFLNVGAQGCIWGFFINYTTETLGISNQEASFLQAIGMVIFMGGRFLGTFLMKYIKPNKMLGYYCVSIVALLLIVTGHFGKVSVGALMLFYLFQSITFPTIFALGVKDLGSLTKNGSSYIIMGIVGGAVFPPIMGYIADQTSMATAFILPTFMFAYIAWYGFRGSQLA